MIVQSENKGHNATVAVAEGSRQAAVTAAGNNQAAVIAAEIVFYRAALASAKANGCGTAAFESALMALGVK